MTGDDLGANDAIGVPGILPSRASKTSFVTTASGQTLYAHQMSCRHRHCCRRPPPTPSLRPCCCRRPRPPTTFRPNCRHCRRRPPPTPSL